MVSKSVKFPTLKIFVIQMKVLVIHSQCMNIGDSLIIYAHLPNLRRLSHKVDFCLSLTSTESIHFLLIKFLKHQLRCIVEYMRTVRGIQANIRNVRGNQMNFDPKKIILQIPQLIWHSHGLVNLLLSLRATGRAKEANSGCMPVHV